MVGKIDKSQHRKTVEIKVKIERGIGNLGSDSGIRRSNGYIRRRNFSLEALFRKRQCWSFVLREISYDLLQFLQI